MNEGGFCFMSIRSILSSLERLLQLHQSLLELSFQKTELLKKGDITTLQKLLKTEQKHIQAVDTMEKKRLDSTKVWSETNQMVSDDVTVTTILEALPDGEERNQLESLTTKLAETLVQLKAQEGLNQQLTNQSLQFVQMNLDMIAPSIKQMNYGNIKNQNDPQSKRSVFDSKA